MLMVVSKLIGILQRRLIKMPDKIMTTVQQHPNAPNPNEGWYLPIHPNQIEKLGWGKPSTLVTVEAMDDRIIVKEVNN